MRWLSAWTASVKLTGRLSKATDKFPSSFLANSFWDRESKHIYTLSCGKGHASESVSTLFLHVGMIIKLQIDSNETVCLIIMNVRPSLPPYVPPSLHFNGLFLGEPTLVGVY